MPNPDARAKPSEPSLLNQALSRIFVLRLEPLPCPRPLRADGWGPIEPDAVERFSSAEFLLYTLRAGPDCQDTGVTRFRHSYLGFLAP